MEDAVLYFAKVIHKTFPNINLEPTTSTQIKKVASILLNKNMNVIITTCQIRHLEAAHHTSIVLHYVTIVRVFPCWFSHIVTFKS